MRRPEDLTGQKFGCLTAVKLESLRPTKWLWKCDCGNEKVINAGSVKSGAVRTCGCHMDGKKPPLVVNVGDKFGRLTVTEFLGTKDRSNYWQWKCECECGNTIVVSTADLRNGKDDCGCVGKGIDLAGWRFGNVTAVRPVGREKGNVVWEVVDDEGHVGRAWAAKLLGGDYTGARLTPSDYSNQLRGQWNKVRNNCTFENIKEFAKFAKESGYEDGFLARKKDKRKKFSPDNLVWYDPRIEVDGVRLRAAEWAEKLKISRQRVSQLVEKGQFEEYVRYGHCKRRPRKLNSKQKHQSDKLHSELMEFYRNHNSAPTVREMRKMTGLNSAEINRYVDRFDDFVVDDGRVKTVETFEQ